MENPIKMDDFRGKPTIFVVTSILEESVSQINVVDNAVGRFFRRPISFLRQETQIQESQMDQRS